MSRRSLDSIESVVESHLCTGCGACAYLQPDRLKMVDVTDVGRRPLPIAGINGRTTGAAVDACPGRALRHERGRLDDAPYRGEWGPVLDLYECWSTDEQLRFRGSSGGVATALAAHAVQSGKAAGALQVQASRTDPLRNEIALNRTYEQIANAAGSRYAPASPCERLDLVEAADGPCVIIGKPCDIAATERTARVRPALRDKIAVTLAIFCAGTPSTRATEKVIEQLGLDPREVTAVDYRGEGWPGDFRAETVDGRRASMSYAQAWGGTLTKNRQWRCLICPDHTGEFADLSIGDPWYREIRDGEPGRSLVVVRNARGRELLESAFAAKAVDGVRLPIQRLPESQPNLAATRGAVWGRVLTMRILGLSAPNFRNIPAFRLWLRLPWRGKLTSTVGTARRARSRGLRRPECDLQEVPR